MEENVTIGQLMRPHGLRGQIKCKPLTHDIRRCEKLTGVFAVKDGNETELSVESASVGSGLWLLKFKGYDTVEAVSQASTPSGNPALSAEKYLPYNLSPR